MMFSAEFLQIPPIGVKRGRQSTLLYLCLTDYVMPVSGSILTALDIALPRLPGVSSHKPTDGL
jgi:hypothetical protein